MPLLHRLAHTPLAAPYVRRLISLFDARLSGAERIPREGAALLVGNHACLGLDSFAFTPLCIRDAGRMPRFLGERNLWRVPGVARFLTSVGAVPGTRDRAVQLLDQGHLVGVYPGGIDDSWKTASEAYRLKWGMRAGFAHIALRARVPILPIVGDGIDDLLTIVARERWVGRRLFGSERYDLPWATGAYGLPFVPRRIPLVFHVLEPIVPTGDANDLADVERVRAATFDAMESVLRVIRALRDQRTSCKRLERS
jgi:1-acyl-sn-glycerol-3-phosphate acyltransferase